ncbi:regulatory protein RecX [Petrachloros mirabilis]
MKRRVRQSPEMWLERAVRYLARFDRTAAQVERFLTSKGASPAQARQTIGRLLDLRYLDDRACASRWVETWLARRPMGRERLKAELLAKGVAEALADKTIGEALQAVDEEALARRAFGSWRNRRQALPGQAAQYLRRRGFDEETIERIIDWSRSTEGSDA